MHQDLNAIGLREQVDHGDFLVDRDAGVIRNVKLCQMQSKNNREYSHRAMRDLEHLYPRLPIRIDHDEKGYLKTVGSIEDVKLNLIEWHIRGDISLNKGHPNYDQIMEDAEKRPHLLKLSHEIPARGYEATRKGETLVVDRVHKVDCFAIVTNGGVNTSLFESAEDDDMDLSQLSFAELKEKAPKLFEELEKTIRDEVARDTETQEERIKLIQERDTAMQKLQEAETRLAKVEADRLKEEREQAIKNKAAEMKVVCSDELLDLLLPIEEDEKITRILSQCPKITEELSGSNGEHEKPTQRSGLGKKPKGYESPADWINRYAGTR